MNKLVTLLFACFLALSLVGCFANKEQQAAKDTLNVTVSILPQKYFVEKIAGQDVSVNVMVRPGASPATYEPKPAQMQELSTSDLYFAIGVPFENVWLAKFESVNPEMEIVKTHQNIDLRRMESSYSFIDNNIKNLDTAEGHDHDHHHHEGMKDPHIWLSPALVKLQTQIILDKLIKHDPNNYQYYTENHQAFLKEIENTDLEIKKILSGNLKSNKIMVFHPSWGYFAEAYGLTQIPIEIEGKEPKMAQLQKLIDFAKNENLKIIFIQPQFSAKTAQIIANNIGGKVVQADPLAYNWSENLINVAKSFKQSLQEE